MRIVLLIGGLVLTGCSVPRFSHERMDVREIETSPLTGIDVSTFNGSVSIQPNDKPVVELKITFKGFGGSEEEAIANCKALSCEPEAKDGLLILHAKKPSDQWMASASFDLKVPSHCTVKVRSSNGKVDVRGFSNQVEASTSNGKILLADVGSVVASTSNGTIDVQRAAGKVDLSTSNGTIKFAGLLVGNENKMRTSNGRIEVYLPTDSLTEIESKTSNGSIRFELPTQKILKEGKRSMHAVVGQGSQEELSKLSLRTSNGSIKVLPVEDSEGFSSTSTKLDSAAVDGAANAEAEIDSKGSHEISL